jgi:molybdopterin adenylyltransferase
MSLREQLKFAMNNSETSSAEIKIGIVTVSDRASRGQYADLSGPAIIQYLRDVLSVEWEARPRIVADEQPLIEAAIIELVDREQCCLVVTTGGTGPALRDVTPEATMAVCDRLMPGFGEAMRAASLAHVPTAILSRQVAGLRGRSLVINLPGSPKAIAECLDAVMPAVGYCIDLLEGPRIETHPERIRTFRPSKK